MQKNSMTFRDFDKIKNYNIWQVLHIGYHKWKVLEIDWDYVKTERVAE